MKPYAKQALEIIKNYTHTFEFRKKKKAGFVVHDILSCGLGKCHAPPTIDDCIS
jgi:hypothetical protein